METSVYRLTKPQLLRYFLTSQLHSYLLPELIPLILYLTFAPYTIKAIVKDKNEEARPYALCLYQPVRLPSDCVELIITRLKTRLTVEQSGLYFLIQTPHYKRLWTHGFSDTSKTPFNQLFHTAIELINKEHFRTGVSMSTKI